MFDDDYRPRPTGPGWLGVILTSFTVSCCVLIAFLLAVQKGYLVVHNVAQPGATPAAVVGTKAPVEHVKVPALVGLPVASATELLSARGLNIVLRMKRANPAAVDTVIAQDPLADSMLPRDAQVVVVLSSGPPSSVTMPALTGMPLADALQALDGAGLKVSELKGPAEGERVVSSVEPAAGSAVERGSAVKLGVELTGVEIPKLVGVPLTKAKKMISEAGFVLGKVRQRYDEHVPAYLILTQAPEAGSRAAKGSAIDLVYSEE